MKRSNRLMLVLGVVLAVMAFGAVLVFGPAPASSQPAEPEMVNVVTAATDIPLGTPLAAELLSTVQRPITDAVDTYRSPDDVLGLVARRPITAGAALSSQDFESGSGAAGAQVVRALEPGQRAIAVPVDMISGVGALIAPGDAVDVILAISDVDAKFPGVINDPQPNPEGPPLETIDDVINGTTVKVLVQNVPVLGLMEPPGGTENGNVVDPVTGQPVVGRMIALLSVTPQEAELIRFTQLDGNLSLVLRGPGDSAAENVTTTGVTLRTLVEEYGVVPPRAVVVDLP